LHENVGGDASVTVVSTRWGSVRGVDVDGAIAWRAIPYASPPSGLLRWQPPQPPAPWAGIRDGSQFSARASQLPSPAFTFPADSDVAVDDPTVTSEDCLYLNVCAPDRPPAAGSGGYPVMVWIHGGGFHFGSGPMFVGDGLQFARDGVVVVTFNYRLGALGFLHVGELLGPRYANASNGGLLDQIAALSWVRDNIAQFGGDPAQVTVAGCSAGGKSVSALLAAPAARGLFHRAISQSGGQHVATAETAAEQATRFLTGMGLGETGARHLPDLPATEILAAQAILGTGPRATWIWRPTVGGDVLPEPPIVAIANGSAAGVPLLAGVTRNEAVMYDLADPTAAEQAPRVLAEIFGAEADDVLATYAANRPGTSRRDLLRAVMGDERYGIPTLRMLDAHSDHGPTWRYRFDAQGLVEPALRGGHVTEIPFVFGLGLDRLDPQRGALARAMHQAWSGFCAGRAPGAEGLPPWPRYDPASRATMVLDTPSRVVHDPDGAERELWEGRSLPESTWWPLPSVVGDDRSPRR
jgi:para-nitrobenzyl esterase